MARTINIRTETKIDYVRFFDRLLVLKTGQGSTSNRFLESTTLIGCTFCCVCLRFEAGDQLPTFELRPRERGPAEVANFCEQLLLLAIVIAIPCSSPRLVRCEKTSQYKKTFWCKIHKECFCKFRLTCSEYLPKNSSKVINPCQMDHAPQFISWMINLK